MPFFMDFHQFENITIDEVKKAHIADVSIQDQYGVKYHQFWVNENAGTVFCLTEGPDKETCELVHKMSHGNIPCALTEVEPGFYKTMMGEKLRLEDALVKRPNGTVDLGYRFLLLVSLRSISASNSKEITLLGSPAWAKSIICENILHNNGRQIKWAADRSFIGVFDDAAEAVRTALNIKQDLQSAHNKTEKIIYTIGISADQPVTIKGEFFSKAIKLAQRLSIAASDNEIFVSTLVKRLCQDSSLENSPELRYIDNATEQFIMKLMDLTENQLSRDDFSIDSLCLDMGISRPQLYRKLTALTHKAPNDFVRDLRLNNTFDLLSQKQDTITQIAFKVGFNNLSYFAKCFAKKYGRTPSEVLSSS